MRVFPAGGLPPHLDLRDETTGPAYPVTDRWPKSAVWPSFSADGKHLFVEERFEVMLWDVTAWPVRHVTTVESRNVLSPDCKLLARWLPSSAVELQDLDSMRVRAILESPDGDAGTPGWEIRFSPDSTSVATKGALHDPPKPGPVTGWFQWLFGFSPSSYRLLSVVRLWSTENGRELQRFPNCHDAEFSPDGHTLATFSDDGTIQLWDLPPRPALGRLISLAALAAIVTASIGWWLGRRRGSQAGEAAGPG
jgi:WD40 repeat protein